MKPPSYFQEIADQSKRRWDQLESDPDLAAPWHQLFKQVQSPRHVLSELLQNADDAEATEAAVDLIDGEFRFAHNGEDFTSDHFQSLCRFGYSNKRALHTIGFRGIGFKSVFSLGDEVYLTTPTLSVVFARKRFTQPRWIDASNGVDGMTQVRVAVKDQHRAKELTKNLEDWVKSPLSLLFFRNVRRLRIGEAQLGWNYLGAGPALESTWVALPNEPDHHLLLVRSQEEEFPSEAIEELRQERMLADAEAVAFPPCRVDLVLGAERRLFVILPTGVQTILPFACNAPFVQDPARVKIKDPETSPTNRWLLERIGRLASATLLSWIRHDDMPLAERARAYELLTKVADDDGTLEGTCAATVKEGLSAGLSKKELLLCDAGNVVGVNRCVALPTRLLDVWSEELLSPLFDAKKRPALCRYVSAESRHRLSEWGFLEQIDETQILNNLESIHPPKPQSWRQLLSLWAYVAGAVTRSYYGRLGLRIVPVQGSDVLFSGREVVRIGGKRLLKSEDDWRFLEEYLRVLNPNWTRFLAQTRHEVEGSSTGEDNEEEPEIPRFVPPTRPVSNLQGDDEPRAVIESAYAVLRALKLDQPSDVDRVLGGVSAQFFHPGEKKSIEDCVRLAEIYAAIGASAGEAFRFVTRDNFLRPTSHGVVADLTGAVEELVDPKWAASHLLHERYGTKLRACSAEEWKTWVHSNRSGLSPFVSVTKVRRNIWGRRKLQEELRRRECQEDVAYPYVTHDFLIDDWDFPADIWAYWTAASKVEPEIWGRLGDCMFANRVAPGDATLSCRISQVATTGRAATINRSPVAAEWIVKFKGLACLRDTRGMYRFPSDLLLRTPETEALLEVEPFVHRALDTEALRPVLRALGVRDTPTGPEGILDRLSALAAAPTPPITEVEKWYRRLDALLSPGSTDDVSKTSRAFRSKRLIRTSGGTWANASEVFILANEEDAPNAPTILPAVADLSLWRRIGVEERPTTELAVAWVKSLALGQTLAPDEVRRVRSLLQRYPDRVWDECGCWLDLEGRIAATGELKYSLSMRSLVPWKDLFAAAKQATADFQMLSADCLDRYPFALFPSLGSRLHEQLHEVNEQRSVDIDMTWLNRLGGYLRRILTDDANEQVRVQELGRRLARTACRRVERLEAVPYIEGIPVGPIRRIAAIWTEELLYVEAANPTRLLAAIVREVGRAFARDDVTEALKICFDRSEEFIAEYVQETFRLAEESPSVDDQIDGRDDGEDQPERKSDHPEAAEIGQPHDVNENDHETLPAESDANGKDEPDSTGPSRKPTQRLLQSPLIERFAVTRGFRRDGEHRYFHPNGSWIAKTNGEAFPWEHRTAQGELVCYYLPEEHCLERQPLKVAAEAWTLCGSDPDHYAFILVDPGDLPRLLTGREMLHMCESNELTLYPAAYRLVHNDSHEQ